MNVLLGLLLAACVTRLWLMPLPSSFWLDELVTSFVVKYPAHPSFAIAPQVPESLYYWLPRAMQALFGFSEVAYRLPSVIAMGIALFLVARIAARLIHPQAAWFAVFACFALSGLDYFADDARPYGTGIAVASAGIFFLIRWLDRARWPDALLFLLFAAALWRVQLIYWPFYAVYAGYAAVRLGKRETGVRPIQIVAVAAVLGASLVPVLFTALSILRDAPTHVIAPAPSLHTFEHALHWNLVLICGFGAWLLQRLHVEQALSPVHWHQRRYIFLITAWWLCTPICLFLYSRLTAQSVFLPRYLSLMLPGVALSATAAAALFIPPDRWKQAAAILGLGAIVWMGQWNHIWPAHDGSDWRSAALEENRLARSAATPVLCMSPFIESTGRGWNPGYALPGFLYAHLSIYPILGVPYLLPMQTSPAAEQYAARLASGKLTEAGRFLLYGQSWQVKFWKNWLRQRPELAGWGSAVEEYGDVAVGIFTRQNPSPGRGPQVGAYRSPQGPG
jgi:hypothetical protein